MAPESDEDLQTFRLDLQYRGTNYAGWQWQPDRPTVQGEIESILSQVTGESIRIHGAGRTDAGVHAEGQVAHFQTATTRSKATLFRALNGLLADDVTVRSLRAVDANFHAQYDARWKSYQYRIEEGSAPSPFRAETHYQAPFELDIEQMRNGARRLRGSHDFRGMSGTFRGMDPNRDTERTLFLVDVHRAGPIIIIDVVGDGFLYHMVRTIAGTLIDMGRGRLAPETASHVLRTGDRTLAGPTAPAHGLCLMHIGY